MHGSRATNVPESVAPKSSWPEVEARCFPRAPVLDVVVGVKHLTPLPDGRRLTVAGRGSRKHPSFSRPGFYHLRSTSEHRSEMEHRVVFSQQEFDRPRRLPQSGGHPYVDFPTREKSKGCDRMRDKRAKRGEHYFQRLSSQ